MTDTGTFRGGTTFDCPLSCDLAITANSSLSCQVRERYLYILHTYDVRLDVLDASGAVLATSSATVSTPSVPNPAGT